MALAVMLYLVTIAAIFIYMLASGLERRPLMPQRMPMARHQL